MRAGFLLSLALICFTISFSQTAYKPSPSNLKMREWFQDARFGMFIHWGASSVLGHGEWVMNNRNIHVNEYTRLIDIFNPVLFDAREWVTTAKNAGMKYITFITRHHDGFSMWDTKQSDWKITNTPYGKDVLKLLADECRRQNIKLFLYYSLLDWYRNDYQHTTGRTGKGTGRTEQGNWNNYISFMKAQLTELLTNYGEIAGIWFDGHWDQLDNDHNKKAVSKVDWKYDEIYSLIHQLQPHCLIGNNHHLEPLPGEDFQMFEKDLPGANTTGFGGAAISKLPLETCETINDSWGFNITDRKYKSVKDLIHYLVRSSGYGANFLLNIGPMPNGKIQPEFVTRLTQMGQWLQQYGETIYGTRGGFMRPQHWGAITQKNNSIYLHLLDYSGDKLMLHVPYKVTSARIFRRHTPIRFQTVGDNYIVLDLKGIPRDEFDTVVELQAQGTSL